MIEAFKAFWVTEEENIFSRSIIERTVNELPAHEILIRVHYSSLNYKDALSASGNKGVTRRYPHTPGVDSAGVVVRSESSRFSPGDKVIVTGFDLGMNTPGGFGQYISVPEAWVVPLPDKLTMKSAMIYGTAGFTAAQCVEKITTAVPPEAGPVLITGVTGGVGSISAAILHKLGYFVTGVSGKTANPILKTIGVSKVIDRNEFGKPNTRALLRERWAAVIDTVGGTILVNAIKSTCYGGVVASCGNAASHELNLTVYPFILRGVTLAGIDSAQTPTERRAIVWNRLANEWHVDIEQFCTEVKMSGLSDAIETMLQGKLAGRVFVNMVDAG